jgi:hypothetical protein
MRTAYVAKRAVPARTLKNLRVRGVETVNDAFEAVAS